MAKGSNDLNMLLKARVVKIRAELDVKGSMPKIRQQVDMISKNLIAKPVKLRVKLDYKIGELRSQVVSLSKQLSAGRGFQPIKLRAELDTKGSTAKIRTQLGQINKNMDAFTRTFTANAKKVESSKRRMDTALATNVPTGTAGVQNFNNIKQYTNQLKEAERIMRSKFADGKGLFQSKEIKDANGNLTQFVGTLERANGVVERVRYGWNANKGQFEVIDRQTTTNIEKNVGRAKASLDKLGNEMKKAGKDADKFKQQYRQLVEEGNKGVLTSESVNKLRQSFQTDQTALNNARALNREEERRSKILREISSFRRTTGLKVGEKEVQQAQKLRKELLAMSAERMRSVDGSKRVAEIQRELQGIKDTHLAQKAKDREAMDMASRRKAILNEIRVLERTSTGAKSGAMSDRFLEETRQMTKSMNTMKEYTRVRSRMESTQGAKKQMAIDNQLANTIERLRTKMVQFGQTTGTSSAVIERRMAQMTRAIGTNVRIAENYLTQTTNSIARFNAQQRITASENSIAKNVDHRKVQNLSLNRDIAGLKEYISQVNKAKIATLSLNQTKSGNFVISTQFESAGKNARKLVQELSAVDGKLRTTTDGMVHNANRNLGVFEQLGIAMKRVPVWMGAMTVFYGSIRSVRAMTNEILLLDKAMTEFRRVASSSLNLESVFKGSMQMAKELGNNVHDVLQAMNDYARTYGEFNERQLLAITNTAVLMSNVSELTAQESTESLIGTMNAFNITAEDSIRIVDALNEVDNNYAVSTQQLATGLQKSASVAETFGVTMEQNIGHITAISSVTMESGNIIGNSLKTIYSRMTTMSNATDALEAVGVAVRSIGEDGVEAVRPVNDILSDLAGTWWELSDAERQHTAVQVAGRYQLSRFLALMNNYDTALSATNSAVNSQGSAMRENAEYLKSFEARINSLKNGFTEFSMAVGDAVLSGSFMAIIEGLRGLAEFGAKAVDVLGGLPIVFGAIFLVMNKMKMFDALKGNMLGFFSLMRLGFKDGYGMIGSFTNAFKTSAQDGQGMLARLATGWNAVATAEGRATVGAKAFGTALKGAIMSTGIGIAIVALGVVIEKLVGKWQEAKQVQEELETMNKNMVDSYRQHSDGMEGLISSYETLSSNTNRTVEEQEELDRVTKELAEGIPTTTEYIDSNGEAHMKTNEQIREAIKAVSDLSQAQSQLEQANFSKNIRESQKAFADVTKEIEKQQSKIEKLQESHGKVTKTNVFGTIVEDTTDNSSKIAERQVKQMMAQAELTSIIQETTKMIQDQSLAYFDASGRMGQLGDVQIGVMEKVASINEHVIRDADMSYESIMQVSDASIAVGEVFAKSFTHLTQGMEEGSEGITKVKDNLSEIASVIPDSFLSLRDSSGNIVKSFADVEEGMKEIINVGHQIQSGNSDYDGLRARLEAIGISGSEANAIMGKLGTTYGNSTIKAMANAQAMDEVADSAGRTAEEIEAVNEAMTKSIDIQDVFFGHGSAELSGIESHLEALLAMEAVWGDGAKEMDNYKDILHQLSNYFEISAEAVDKDKVALLERTEALMAVSMSDLTALDFKDMNIDSFLDTIEFASDRQRQIAKDAIEGMGGVSELIDPITGKIKEDLGAIEDASANTGGAVEDVWKAVNNPISNDSFLTSILEGNFVNPTLKLGEYGFMEFGETVEVTDGKFGLFRDHLGQPIFVDTSSAKESIVSLDHPINQTKEKVGDLRMDLSKDTPASFENAKKGIEQVEEKAKDGKGSVDDLHLAINKPMNENAMLGRIGLQTSLAQGQVDTLKSKIEGLENVNMGSLTESLQAISNMSFDSIDGLKDKMSELSKISNLDGLGKSMSGVAESVVDLRTKTASLIMLMGTMNKSIPTKPLDGMAKSINSVSASLMLATGMTMAVSQSYMLLSATLSNVSNYANLFSVSMARSTVYSIQSAQASLLNARAKNQESSAYVRSALIITAMSQSYSNMSRSATTASSQIRNALVQQMAVMIMLGTSYSLSSKVISVAFSRMSSAVSKSSSSMIRSHNSQRNAINNLAKTANTARTSIEKLNSSARNAMTGINNYVRAARTMASAGASVANAPRIASLGNVGLSDSVSESASIMSSSISTFSASSEGSTSSFGGGEGSSGIMQQSIYNTGYGENGLFSSSALADLYKVDTLGRRSTTVEGVINNLRAQMEVMEEFSKKYRDSLRAINRHENEHYKIMSQQLRNAESRNRAIEVTLNKLKNTSRHSEKQREDYNRLQQEYDENLGRIASLRVEVTKAMQELAQAGQNILGNLVDEITSKIQKSVDAINKRIETIDFKIEVYDLTEPDNVGKRIELLTEKTIEYVRERSQYRKTVADLEVQLARASRNYGKDSDIVQKIAEELEKAEKALQDVTISILKTEKEIKDIRGSVSDDIIAKLKDTYKKSEKMALDSSNKQTEIIRKAHEVQMKLYDEEIKKINDVYSAKLEAIDKEESESTYEKELADRNLALSKLVETENKLARDNSLEGRKRYSEIQEERKKAQEELDKFMKDRHKELLKEQLNAERDSQLEAIENKKESEQESVDAQLEALEKEREAISEHYESIIEDEEKWSIMRSELIKGNFDGIKTHLEEMGITLEQISNGTFETLSKDFASYSDEVRKFIEEMNGMVGQINKVPLPSQGGSLGNAKDEDQISYTTVSNLGFIIEKAYKGIDMDIPTPDKNRVYDLIANTSIPQRQMEEIFRKAKIGQKLDIPTPEKQMFYDLFLEILGRKVDSYDTGGYTGDWAGSGGIPAVLHKKELVLNENQTAHILDVARIVDKMKNVIPMFSRSNVAERLASGSMSMSNNYYLTLEIERLTGDKEGAKVVVKEILDGLKKMGR